jgi:hypothetical protein
MNEYVRYIVNPDLNTGQVLNTDPNPFHNFSVIFPLTKAN